MKYSHALKDGVSKGNKMVKTKQNNISKRRKEFIQNQNKKEHEYLCENLEYKKYNCTHCNKILVGDMDWAELSTKDNKYYWNGTPTEKESQGWFPFGLDCIKKCEGFV